MSERSEEQEDEPEEYAHWFWEWWFRYVATNPWNYSESHWRRLHGMPVRREHYRSKRPFGGTLRPPVRGRDRKGPPYGPPPS